MSELQGSSPTGKNIIICCDGTNNQLDGEFSNVAKLYSVLEKIPGQQVVYYDPGVGTLGDPRFALRTTQALSRYLGLAFGYGFRENISEAYAFLMDTYEEGDRIFLFGFSRGAFTVRSLAGVLHTCGLVEKRNQNLLPYLFRIHMRSSDTPEDGVRAGGDGGKVYGKEAAKRFKEIYARTVRPHFLGIFDTVTSLGWVHRRTYYPYSTQNPDVRTVRHAVSIDERRAQYRSNLWTASDGQDVREVWFSGVHSDIGGGYPEEESGLAKIPLAWMVAEAYAAGLRVDIAKYGQIVLGENQQPGRAPYVAPDPAARLHESLAGPWWLLEYVPTRSRWKNSPLRLPRAQYRDLRGRPFIHQSVLDRVRDVPGYRPPELFDKDGDIRPALRIEPYPASPFYPERKP